MHGSHPPENIPNFAAQERLDCVHRGVRFSFATRTALSKAWFYPRYGMGSLHEPAVCDVLADILRPEHVFFDVGANLGFFTVLAAHLCREVHAFEIDPHCVAQLDRSLSLNTGICPVRLVNAACMDPGRGMLTFAPRQLQPHANASNMVRPLDAPHNGNGPAPSRVTVLSLALDEYVRDTGTRPDVVKMDIEGAEWFALSGMSNILAYRPVLLVEVHPEPITRYGGDPSAIEPKLRALGYDLRQVNLDSDSPLAGRTLDAEGHAKTKTEYMLLCTPASDSDVSTTEASHG